MADLKLVVISASQDVEAFKETNQNGTCHLLWQA
jgi:hypothetical protein